jgi:holliday junction DNA helicase RuvA
MEDIVMIAKLKGVLDSIGLNWVILDVNGIGYLVYCSSKTLMQVNTLGSLYTLFTETIVREDLFNLYGFASEKERDWFRLLTTVQGVGMKAGLAILSAIDPQQLQEAIINQDHSSLTQADGIGPKLATRIVHELKDKAIQVMNSHLNDTNVIHINTRQAPSTLYQDALSALLNLGYKSFEANQAVAFARQHPHNTVEDVIRLSLARLSQAKV